MSSKTPYTTDANGYRAATLDEIMTGARQALALVDIRVLDHLIVAGGDTLSFAKRGLL